VVSGGDIQVDDKEDRIIGNPSNEPQVGQKADLGPPGAGQDSLPDFSQIYSKGETGRERDMSPSCCLSLGLSGNVVTVKKKRLGSPILH